MPNQFCRYLSNGYSFNITKNNSIAVGPCCLYQNKIPFDLQLLQTRKVLFESITDWTPNCSVCHTLESVGQQSLRQSGPDWIGDDEKSQDPISIDIHLDNECNAACVICNENSSSLWKKQNLKFNKLKVITPQDYQVDQQIDHIAQIVKLDRLRYVKFFGGEPLYTDTHLKFIRQIPHPEQITLHYTTNGSIYPNTDVLEAWKKFKTVIFSASLDGIEQQFDYLRWPLPWHKVSANLIRLKENKDLCNLMFRVEFTANFLNTYYFDRLEDWVKHNLHSNLGGDLTEINIHDYSGNIWNLEKMPENIRIMILEKYPQDHILHKMIAGLTPPESLEPWQQFVNKWDVQRNNSWRIAFPDLKWPGS